MNKRRPDPREKAEQALLTFRLATVAAILAAILLLSLAHRYGGSQSSFLEMIGVVELG